MNIPWGIILSVAVPLITSSIGLYEYLQRPKVVTGVVPIDEIRDGEDSLENFGKYSLIDDFIFEKGKFAKEISEEEIKEEKVDRKVKIKVNEGVCNLPLLLQNIGNKSLENFGVAINFVEDPKANHPQGKVKIRELSTETLVIEDIFCDKDEYKGKEGNGKIPSENIIQYWQELGLSGHWISLLGHLGSGTSEIIHIQVEVPRELTWFYIIIEVDSPQWFVGEKTFCQFVKLEHNR